MMSINSFNALELTIYNMTDVKNKDGCKLCSCSHADRNSGAGLPFPEHRDNATVGHSPLASASQSEAGQPTGMPQPAKDSQAAQCHRDGSPQAVFWDDKG